MNWTTRGLAMIFMANALLGLRAAPASALGELSYIFIQDGYSGGATVTGAFSGIDVDNNGILVHFPSPGGGPPIAFEELTAFSAHFSGNSLSPPFDLTLEHLYGFVYQVGTPAIGDDPAYDPTLDQNLTEGIGAIGPVRFFTSGLGPNRFFGGFIGGQIDFGDLGNIGAQALDSSSNLVMVTAVPEPTSISLVGGALFAAVSAFRPRRITGLLHDLRRRCIDSRS